MKSLIVALSLAVASAGFLAPATADAKRLGGGSSLGMQRSLPARAPTPTPSPPARPAQAAPAPAAAGVAAAAAPRRSWLGPLAGVAAGLGIAALMSHLGFGAGMGDFLSLLLMAIVAFVAIRFLLRRFAPGAGRPMATANGAAFQTQSRTQAQPFQRAAEPQWTGAAAAPVVAVGPSLPPGFDKPAFERIAKGLFIRLQTANDRGDLNDISRFTSPELYSAIRLDLQERGNAAQQTDAVQLDAEVLDFATEPDRQVVSVRYHGLIREQANGPAEPFDEVWHLTRPTDDSRDWTIAGIQQRQLAG